MKKVIGLWLDREEAVIALVTNTGVDIRRIRSQPAGAAGASDAGQTSTAQGALGRQSTSQLNQYYDTYLNQWIQPDTIIPNISNPQTLNKYSYVVNDPINLTDPNGHDPWWCDNSSNPAKCYQDYYNSISRWTTQDSTSSSQPPVSTATSTPNAPIAPSSTCTATITATPLATATPVLSQPGNVLSATWKRYLDVRDQLPTVIDPNNGTIDDTVFLAMVISAELGIEKSKADVFGEAMEGLSRQYYGYGCHGKCTDLENQLHWADSMQGWSVHNIIKDYPSYMDDAKLVKGNGSPYLYPGNGGALDAWWWGNYDWNSTTSPMGDYFRSGEDSTKASWWTEGGKPYLAHDPDNKFVVLTFRQNIACGNPTLRATNSGKNCLGF